MSFLSSLQWSYKVDIRIAVRYYISRLLAENGRPTLTSIICKAFNKGTIYNNVVRVRAIPSITCLVLVTVEFFCYKSKTEMGAKGLGVEDGEGCLKMLSTGIEYVKGWGWFAAILQQWSEGDLYFKVTLLSPIFHLEAREQGSLFTFPYSAEWRSVMGAGCKQKIQQTLD